MHTLGVQALIVVTVCFPASLTNGIQMPKSASDEKASRFSCDKQPHRSLRRSRKLYNRRSLDRRQIALGSSVVRCCH